MILRHPRSRCWVENYFIFDFNELGGIVLLQPEPASRSASSPARGHTEIHPTLSRIIVEAWSAAHVSILQSNVDQTWYQFHKLGVFSIFIIPSAYWNGNRNMNIIYSCWIRCKVHIYVWTKIEFFIDTLQLSDKTLLFYMMYIILMTLPQHLTYIQMSVNVWSLLYSRWYSSHNSPSS